MANVWIYHAVRLSSLKEETTTINAMTNIPLQNQYFIALEEKFLSIMFECAELSNYWNDKFLKKVQEPADLLINKVERFYFPSNPIVYNPAEFVIQHGLFIATDITGFERTMCFEITSGNISNGFVIDYGNLTVVNCSVVIFSKYDLGGYTGSSPTISLTAYPVNNQNYHETDTAYCVDKKK